MLFQPWSTGLNPVQRTGESIFKEHISDGTLALCDGLMSYHTFTGIADCTVKDCMNQGCNDAYFFNLNTVNGFHSFIKRCYEFYRGVARKYINRYNTLFAVTYRNAESIIRRLTETVLEVTRTNYYHNNKDVRMTRILAIWPYQHIYGLTLK